MTIRDQVFLYCNLIYGHKDEVLAVLPQSRMELLTKEARKYDRFPKEVRLRLVLKLLGYLVRHMNNRYPEMIHPSWIADFLKNERSLVREIVLEQFSPEYRNRVAAELGIQAASGGNGAERKETREMVWQIFSSRFVSMAAPAGDPRLSVETLYLLREKDLMELCKYVGIREIARVFSVAGKGAVAALANRFPPELQRDFFDSLASVAGESPDRMKFAARNLSRYDLASIPLEEAALKVGLGKIGCVLQENQEDLKRVAQRLPKPLGTLLTAVPDTQTGEEEAADVTKSIEILVSKGKIDKSFVENRFLSGDIRRRSTRVSSGFTSSQEKSS